MAVPRRLILGQFSSSPVIAAAQALGLDAKHGLQLEARRVQSSPGQFGSLRAGDIDVAVTSPDNVLLYATTDRNPLGERLEVAIIRAVDRGLGLTLFTQPRLESAEAFVGARIGVDVIRSGFALLLFRMLDGLGVDRSTVDFPEHGSTPNRLEILLNGEIDGTIVNAESRIRALHGGLRSWATAIDVSPNYLGAVLATRRGLDAQATRALVAMWDETTAWLLESPVSDVVECLGAAGPVLGSAEYVQLIRDPNHGLLADPHVSLSDLEVLASIRHECGAYVPPAEELPMLVQR